MCGINGIIALNQSEEDTDTLEKNYPTLKIMNDLTFHRGPDSEGVFIRNPVSFGFRRLSIIDLSTTANQPMLSADGSIILVFNGEIYNYIELRHELEAKGHHFKTHSDTEVIINSYIEYGDRCINKFNGMWAFAIYDFRRNKLFCSRDRLGVKPFYYCFYEHNLFFSSELKVLHRVCHLQNANHGKVYEYLAYGYRINDGETFFENCFELLPGTNLIRENGNIQLKKYWKLEQNSYKHSRGLSLHEEYSQLFESAVKLRYRSDVPVALLLSGGLDSSAIGKVTDNLIEKGDLGINQIQAYIASFPNFKDDETAVAREFVKTCKHIKLNEFVISAEDVVDDFDKIIYGFDHPVGSFASVAHNLILRECHQRGIKVVLNGQGSDEAFAGYDRYIAGVHLIDQLLSKPANFIREFRHLNCQNKYSVFYLASQMLKSVLNQNYSSYLRARYKERSIPCLDSNFVRSNRRHYNSAYRFSLKGNNLNCYLLNKINHQDLNTILHYEDVSSMMNSVEIRSPFMDYRLMEFAFSIPLEMKFRQGITKVIQRETIGKMLPDSITKNRNKIGFKTPFTDYISTPTNYKTYIFDILNSRSFKEKKIWNSDRVIKAFSNPAQNPDFPFWRVINLEVWSKVYNISNL